MYILKCIAPCLKQSFISTTQWQVIATDRSTWRPSIHDGLMLCDDSRREDCHRASGRTCSSRIGILSHERACNEQRRMAAIVVSTGSITCEKLTFKKLHYLFSDSPRLRSPYYTLATFDVCSFVCIPSAKNNVANETHLCIDNRVA